MSNIIYLVLVLVVCFLARYTYRWYKNRNILAPPVYPGSLPLIGHGPIVIGDCVHLWNFIKSVSDYCLQNEGIATVNLAVMDLQIITDPDIFVTISNTFLDKAYLYDFAKEWLGDGMITSPVTSMSLDSEELGIEKDVYLRTIQDLQKIFIERFTRVWLHPSFLFNFSNLKKEQDRLVKLSNEIILKLIRTRRSIREKNKNNNNGTSMSKFRSFLDILLEISESSKVLSDKQIKDEVETMMLAGHESVGYFLVTVLVILGSYQDVQQKAYEECKAVFGDTDRDVEKDDLLKLVYMEAVLMEILRLYPVGPIIGRYVDRDIQLRDFTIKAGTSCILSVYGVQRHPMWGPDPHQFRPERWLDKASLPQHPAAFTAFSRGKRACIGKTYAMMLMKTTISHILRRYHVTADITQVVYKFNIVLQPESGHFVTIRRRDK